MTEALRQRGAEHERAYVESLRAQGLQIRRLTRSSHPTLALRRRSRRCAAGQRSSSRPRSTGNSWLGYADILRRVRRPAPSVRGRTSPTTRSSRAKRAAATILQLSVYADLLEGIQQALPERFQVVTPGDADDAIRGHALPLRRLRRLRPPRPRPALGHARSGSRCDPEGALPGAGRAVRRLPLGAALRETAPRRRPPVVHRGHRPRPPRGADGAGVLRRWRPRRRCRCRIAFKPTRGSRDTYRRIREQARVQLEQRTAGQPVHELLLPVVEGQGLARLPEPVARRPVPRSRGRDGSRAKAGASTCSGCGAVRRVHPPRRGSTTVVWAFTDAEERAAFEATIDRIMRTLAADPGVHVYHFGHYEPSAFKRLMGRYATRAEQLDELLRGERFVDLYAVVRQALRAGVESYSIKKLEPFYGFARALPLARCGRSPAGDRAGAGGRTRRRSIPDEARPRSRPTTRTTAGRRRRCATGWSACARSSRRRAPRCHGRLPKAGDAEREGRRTGAAPAGRAVAAARGRSAGSLQPGSRAASALAARVSVGLAPSRGQVGVVGVLPAA